MVYKIFNFRISAFPRNISVYFSKFNFSLLYDKSNGVPTLIDPNEKRRISVETELNSFLTTNEITLQFMGIFK